jgi:hypothetical protein
MFDDKPKNPGSFKPGDLRIRPQWRPGQSGNPLGRSKRRRQFDEALADTMATDHPEEAAQELADIVWAAARKGESWAVQLLFQRLSPQPLNVRMEVERRQDEIDFSKFTDAELEQFGRILERIDSEKRLLES